MHAVAEMGKGVCAGLGVDGRCRLIAANGVSGRPQSFAAKLGTAVRAVFLLQDTATHPCSLHSPLQVPWHAVLGNHDYCDSAPGCNTTDGCPNSPLHQVRV